MSQPKSRIHPHKPPASRSPSPDISSRHLLLRTQPVEMIAPPQPQKIPLIQEVMNLHNENKRLKDLLANNKYGDLKRELEEKEQEIRELKSQLPESVVNRRLFPSSNQSLHQSLRASTDRRRLPSEQDQRKDQELSQLRQRMNELIKDNQQLRKSLLLRSIRSEDRKELDFNKIKKEALDIMNRKIEDVENNYNTKIKELNDRIERMGKSVRKEVSDEKRQSTRIMEVVSASRRDGSTVKKEGQKYETPKKDEALNHIEAQLTVSKNNIKELQRQNDNLLQDNLNLKKAYELLLKKSYTHPVEPQDPSPSATSMLIETQSQLNRLSLQNKSLKETLQDLRNNTSLLENQNQDLRIKLNSRLSASTRIDKDDEKRLSDLERSTLLISKQRDLLKKQLQNMSSTNERLLFEGRSLEEENIRLKQENEYLRNNIQDLTSQQANQLNKGNSKLQEIWNQLNLSRKKIESLQLRNKQLQKELMMKGVQQTSLHDKDQEIFMLKDELNKALTEQRKIATLSNGENDDLRRQLSSLRTRLSEADKMLEQVNGVDTSNKKEVAGLLKGLEEVKRMLDRISFEALEASLREVGFRYKTAVEERIQLLKRLKDRANDGSRIEIENERLKREIVDLNTKYINQKSNRQSLEAKLQQQLSQSSILKDQINELNRVVGEYIIKKIDIKGTEESRVRELEADIIEDKTERDIGELRELESQVRAVGARLHDILQKAHFQFQGTPLTHH